jgi:hypothetical protein
MPAAVSEYKVASERSEGEDCEHQVLHGKTSTNLKSHLIRINPHYAKNLPYHSIRKDDRVSSSKLNLPCGKCGLKGFFFSKIH